MANTGMYSIHFRSYDRAGNYETARVLFLYDNNDIIDTGKGKTDMKNTIHYLGKRWITNTSPFIEVAWKDTFVKTNHVNYNWLANVHSFPNILSIYDDNSGKRTVKSVSNVKGKKIYFYWLN